MGWDGPILTDSGGFQLFSLAKITRVSEAGAQFRSHIDGRLLEITPEQAVAIQEALGSDVAMVLDHVVALPNDPEVIRDATDAHGPLGAACPRCGPTRRSGPVRHRPGGARSGVAGPLRRALAELDFPGYAVGGLSVGEAPAEMYRVLEYTVPAMPADRPRYLMGVGRPEDILQAVRHGIDLFDCVMPTRNGRNAMAFTDFGTMRLRNLQYQRDPLPLEADCPCPACRRSRGYLRHLFMAGEMLGPILLSIHNVTYYQRLLAAARAAIEAGRFEQFVAEKIRGGAVRRRGSGAFRMKSGAGKVSAGEQ